MADTLVETTAHVNGQQVHSSRFLVTADGERQEVKAGTPEPAVSSGVGGGFGAPQRNPSLSERAERVASSGFGAPQSEPEAVGEGETVPDAAPAPQKAEEGK